MIASRSAERAAVQHFAVGIAAVEVADRRHERALSIAGMLLGSCLMLATAVLMIPDVAHVAGLARRSLREVIQIIVIAAIAYVVAVWPLLLPRRWHDVVGTMGMLTWLVLSLGVYGTMAYQYRDTRLVIVIALVLVVALITAAGGLAMITVAVHHRFTRDLPLFAVCRELLAVHVLLNNRPIRFIDAGLRRRISTHLDAAAEVVVERWPRYLRVQDSVTRNEIRAACNGFAQRLHGLTQATAWPTSDAHRTILGDVETILRNLVSGDLHALGLAEATKSIVDKRRRAAEAAAGLAFALAPLVLLLVVRSLGVAVPVPVAPWLGFVAYAWAILGVLLLADPALEKRLAGIRAVIQLIRPGKSD